MGIGMRNKNRRLAMSYSFIKYIATGWNFSTSLLKLEVNVITVFWGIV